MECFFFKNWIWKKDWRSMGTPQRVAGDHIPCKVIGGSMWFPWFTLPSLGTDSFYFYPFLTAGDSLQLTQQRSRLIWMQVQICAPVTTERSWPELTKGQRCCMASSTYNSKVNVIVYKCAPCVVALSKHTRQWGRQVMISEKHTHDKPLIPDAHHAARLLKQPSEQAT